MDILVFDPNYLIESTSGVAFFFIFVYKYGKNIKEKLCIDIDGKPTHEKIIQQSSKLCML